MPPHVGVRAERQARCVAVRHPGRGVGIVVRAPVQAHLEHRPGRLQHPDQVSGRPRDVGRADVGDADRDRRPVAAIGCRQTVLVRQVRPDRVVLLARHDAVICDHFRNIRVDVPPRVVTAQVRHVIRRGVRRSARLHQDMPRTKRTVAPRRRSVDV